MSSSSSSSKNLCHVASFSSENTLIKVIPAFNFPSNLPLLSLPSTQSVGPFVAGIEVDVPLWMAKLLHQRQLAQIQIPSWLSPEYLSELLVEEKESTVLTNKLPYYYYEIARSLSNVDGFTKSTQILLQDLVAVRLDKIRQHFHDLSKNDLSQGEMHMITVTGMGSIELNKVGPFLKQAFSDYGYLTRKSKDNNNNSTNGEVEVTTAGGGVGVGVGSEGNDHGKGKMGEKIVQESQTALAAASAASTSRNKLRRFRGTQ